MPGWIVAKILNSFGVLRISREAEILGQDFVDEQESAAAAADVHEGEKAAI